jgi:hypothetical protein
MSISHGANGGLGRGIKGDNRAILFRLTNCNYLLK